MIKNLDDYIKGFDYGRLHSKEDLEKTGFKYSKLFRQGFGHGTLERILYDEGLVRDINHNLLINVIERSFPERIKIESVTTPDSTF